MREGGGSERVRCRVLLYVKRNGTRITASVSHQCRHVKRGEMQYMYWAINVNKERRREKERERGLFESERENEGKY